MDSESCQKNNQLKTGKDEKVDNFVRSSPNVRSGVFRETAKIVGTAPMIIEKDFWVVWLLAKLFGLSNSPPNLVFKGGTTLSKAYRLTRRFSEDIDLSVHRHDLGFNDENDPASENISKNRRRTLIKKLRKAGEDLAESFVKPALVEAIGNTLDEKFSIEVNPEDRRSLFFEYPQSLSEQEYGNSYVQRKVLMEFGTRSEQVPTYTRTITPYVADEFENLLDDPVVSVKTLGAERTFWEKATICHRLFHQFPTKQLPERMSRHYYDFARIAESDVFGKAMENIHLLAEDARHKAIFYQSAGANYETAVPGSIHLTPHNSLERALREDYKNFESMIFGEPPAFEDILDRIEKVEKLVNCQT